MQHVVMTGSIKEQPYLWLASSTIKDRMTLTMNLRGTKEDEKRVQDLLVSIVHTLRQALEQDR